MERYTVPPSASITPEHITIRPIVIHKPTVERIIQTEPLPTVARPVEPVVVTEHHHHTHTEKEVIHVREFLPSAHVTKETHSQPIASSRKVDLPLQQPHETIQAISPVASDDRPEEIPVEVAPTEKREITPLQGDAKNQIVPEKKIKSGESEIEPEKSNQETPKNQMENHMPFEKKSKVTLILAKPETAQGAEKPKFFKKVGRQRTEEKTKDVIVYRLTSGKWPHGLSEYMQWYYDTNYIQTKGKQYAKTRQWKAEIKASKTHAPRPGAHIVPILKRASA